MENSQTILEQKEMVQENIKGGEEILSKLNKDYADTDVKIKSLKGYEKEWKNYEEAKQKEDKIDREISQLMNRLSTTETEELKISTQLTTQETLIQEYYSNEKKLL